MEVNLIELSHLARWESATLRDENGSTRGDDANLRWEGTSAGCGETGGVHLSNTKIEDNQDHDKQLHMHPKWVSKGTIKGWYPWKILPENACFSAEIGFGKGAVHTDGVTFMVYEHHWENGREVWNRIARWHKTYTGEVWRIGADLSHLSGQNVGIELRVDAGESSAQDWAVWINPRVVSSETFGSMPVTIELQRFVCRNADEDYLGDEPYLLTYAYFIDGRNVRVDDIPNSESRVLYKRRTHGNLRGSVRGGDSFAIKKSYGTYEYPMVPIQGIGDLGKDMARAGIIVLALEEDVHPSTGNLNNNHRDIRNKIKQKIDEQIQNFASSRNNISGQNIQSGIQELDERMRNEFGNRGWLDVDEYVGVAHEQVTYKEIQQNRERRFTMEFRATGIHYEVIGRFKNA